ncbi:MAG: EsaB/YukD family protein [Desulfitobacteriaceae bacterium]|nr:EsaB/YukD family protein [Desulfitobacteriaceae bacterium]MDD3833787.1 EsaB/YukD family protein [Oscillospiraceae bacterium]MDD4401883.1 EsaB/YukD family protein [Desulfitobacteriaceae bacterium]
MDYILLTFCTEDKEIDLKVPTFIKMAELLSLLAVALNIPISSANKLQAEPLGRILDNDKTLEQEMVTQGSLLTLI